MEYEDSIDTLAYITRLETQRNELLDALRELTIACEDEGVRCMDHLLANSRAAIEAATKQS